MASYQPKHFMFEGTRAHYIEGGSGFPLLLIHGSGPGASTSGNWRLILEPLAQKYHVFAMDLIGFGLSGRRAAPPFFDIDFWQRQCQAMLDLIPGKTVGILGHSLSGALALKLTAADSRISKTMTTGSMGAAFAVNADTSRCWTFPADRAALRATAEMLIHDHSHITEAYIDDRVRTLFENAEYRAYFTAMFEGEHSHFAAAAELSPVELARIKTPVTMLHGRNDTAFPPEITMALADSLAQADVILLAHCSHSIALEYPEKLLAAADLLFG